jgi:hypothetical protein
VSVIPQVSFVHIIFFFPPSYPSKISFPAELYSRGLEGEVKTLHIAVCDADIAGTALPTADCCQLLESLSFLSLDV